jgi:hypothetical protein
MTLVSAIIKSAYRESNLIPIGTEPSTAQVAEGLSRLNTLILSTIGREVGEPIRDLNIGGANDESYLTEVSIPANARLVLNLSASITVHLSANPYEGQRLAAIDAAGSLGTYTLTLDGNGRNIEGTSTIALSVDGTARQWLYRADTSNWVKINSLTTTDEMPLSEEFDDYFILMLAMRLNPMYGQAMTSETVAALKRQTRHITSRYRSTVKVLPEYMGKIGERGYISDDFEEGQINW